MSVHYWPSKGHCARKLRKVFPSAFFRVAEPNEKGEHGLELCYKNPLAGTVPFLTVHGPRESVLPFVALKRAFERYGFASEWHPSEGLKLTPIEGYQGPESLVPIELDPTATSPEQVREGIAKLDFSNSGVDTIETGN